MKSLLRASAFLFLLTALATGWQVLQFILWGFWGRPYNPLEHVALAGALVLMIGALVTFCSRPPGPVIAMVGCAILWIYYGPALWHMFAQVFSRQLALNLLVFLPPLLLVASSTLAIMTLVTRRGLSEQSAPFPIRKSRHIVFERLALGAIAAIVIVVVLALPDEFGSKECFKNQYTGSSSMSISDRVQAIFSKGVRVPSGSTFSVPDMPEHYSYVILLVHPRFLVRSGGVRRKIDHRQSLLIFSWGGVDRLKVTHQLADNTLLVNELSIDLEDGKILLITLDQSGSARMQQQVRDDSGYVPEESVYLDLLIAKFPEISRFIATE